MKPVTEQLDQIEKLLKQIQDEGVDYIFLVSIDEHHRMNTYESDEGRRLKLIENGMQMNRTFARTIEAANDTHLIRQNYLKESKDIS